MISNETVASAMPIVEALNKSNCTLIASENSPIFVINDASQTPLIDSFEGETGFLEAWMESLGRVPALGTPAIAETSSGADNIVTIHRGLHGATMDEAADIIASSVKRAVKHARTVASPTIGKVINLMNEHVAQATVIKEPYEIIDVALPKIWYNFAVEQSLASHSSMAKTLSRSRIKQCPCPENLVDHLRTGAASFDEAFEDALKETGLDPAAVFNYLFNESGDIHGYRAPAHRSRNLNLVAFLMASVLIAKPVPDSGYSGLEWESILTEIIDVLGSGCVFAKEMYNDDIEANVLIMDKLDNEGKIRLNAPVYDRWLNSGGTPEVLIGALITSEAQGCSLAFDDLLENKQGHLNVWESYHATRRATEDIRRIDKFKDGLYTSLCVAIDELPEHAQQPKDSSMSIRERARIHVQAIEQHELADPTATIAKVTCDALFYYTPAKYLLSRINDHTETGMSVDEAASAVLIEYTTDWLVSGLGIKLQG